MSARPLAWTVLLIVAAGCADPGAQDDGQDTQRAPRGSAQMHGPVARFNATDCFGSAVIVYVPVEAVQPELPAGYAPAQNFGTPLNNPHLFAVRCKAMQVDGATFTDVKVAATGTLLDGGDFYRWEVFVEGTEGALTGLLAEAGWTAHDASITIEEGRVAVSAPGIQYDAELPAPPEPHDKHDGAPEVYDHVGDDGRRRWMQERLDKQFYGNQGLSAVRLEATGGALGSISERVGTPFTAGLTNHLASDWTVEMHIE